MPSGNYITSGPTRSETESESPRQYLGEKLLAPMPPKQDTIHPIMIRQLNHGYIVEVGCQTFAIESASNLISKLSEYILNPSATEGKWNDGKLF